MKKHLAIFTPSIAKQIFNGNKKIESRFSKKKIAPYGEVEVGDLVYIKPTGSDLAGQFIVKKVIYFQNLDLSDWQLIKDHYATGLALGSREDEQHFFSKKVDCVYGTILFIDQVEQFLTAPVQIDKKDRRGWVVLD